MRGRSGGRGGIADARRYSPRGRTTREGTSRDPFRPALELLHGGPEGPETGAGGRQPGTGRQGGAGREPSGTGRESTGRGAGARTAAGRRATPRQRTPVRRGTGRTGGVKGRGTPARRPIRKPRRPPRLGHPLRRLRLGTLLVVVVFTAIAGRLVALQLTDARKIALEGLADRLVQETVFAPRGAIYDRDRNVLAESVEARYVYADPSQIKPEDVNTIADKLRDVIGVPASVLIQKLSRKVRADGSKDEFEYLKRGVDIGTGDAVKALNLPGIRVARDEQRTEPGNDLAANLIGFTNDNGDGAVGLESAFNSLLRGQDGLHTFEVGAGDLNTAIPGGYDDLKAARPGSSLELTIDRDLQFQVQHILATRMSQVNADFGCAVVLDVHNGDVLAQASYPGYNAANPDGVTSAQMVDSCSQTVVDPGSVHKVITLGAALQTGAITANSMIPVPGGSITKGGTRYADAQNPLRAGSKISIPGILAWSSNVGTITVADMMSPQTLYDYQLKFGLGKATGEGMPGESPGLVQPPANWSGPSYGSIPIGMGVSVTPLQMAAVYTTIANDGVYVTPRLIKATIGPDGTVHDAATPASHRVLTSANAATLRTDLQAVVTAPLGTGHSAALPAYGVAGKTGTGALVKDGKYAPGDVGSFIGMSPADNPRYVIAVFAHSPGGEGGTVAAPAFHDMMSTTLMHFGVPPTGTRTPTFVLSQ